jgi:hypothetical protein
VNQVEVDLLEPEAFEARIGRGAHGVAPLVAVPQLGGDEELVARNSGCRDRLTDARLVLIDARRVDVPLADLERIANDASRFVVVDLPHP